MENEKLDSIINDFLSRFNKMCESQRKDFLIRERMVEYEYSSAIKKYNVTYRILRKKNEWLIEAENGGFWIFKKRFPLLKIIRKEGTIGFSGMFTYSFPDFKVEELEMKLNKYLEVCKKQPKHVFTKS